jgi:hypothetical protein
LTLCDTESDRLAKSQCIMYVHIKVPRSKATK